MDELTRAKINGWFADMLVDGWVEVDEKGHLYVELFHSAIVQRGFAPGDFVRMRIVTEEELSERPEQSPE